MQNSAVRVKAQDAELTKKLLRELKLFDNHRRVTRSAGCVELPVISEKISLPIDFKLVEQKAPRFKEPRLSFEYVKEALKCDLTEQEMANFRGGWERIGDVLILELPEPLLKKKKLIGKKMLQLVPGVKTVVNRQGIKHEFRQPEVEILAGEGRTETVHREHGCKFRLDVARVMFSAGNIEERRRMAHVSNPSELVVDMFAGIGQFTIPIAKHSRARVIAIEKNPEAFRYLQENIRLNKLSNVEARLDDCREAVPERAANRVIMGYFFDVEKFLPSAVAALKHRGVIHVHDLVRKKEAKNRAEALIKTFALLNATARLQNLRFVKSYSPQKWHAVFDFQVRYASV